jgi:hypothetical protein
MSHKLNSDCFRSYQEALLRKIQESYEFFCHENGLNGSREHLKRKVYVIVSPDVFEVLESHTGAIRNPIVGGLKLLVMDTLKGPKVLSEKGFSVVLMI